MNLANYAEQRSGLQPVADIAPRSVDKGMPLPLYKFVREKLVSHGVDRSPDGQITISDKHVFLRFVRLERAIRTSDFTAAQVALNDLEAYLILLGKRHVIVFAYMYLEFSTGGPKRTRETQNEDGGVLRSIEYRCPTTLDQRIIADWGRWLFEQSGYAMLRVVYASRK